MFVCLFVLVCVCIVPLIIDHDVVVVVVVVVVDDDDVDDDDDDDDDDYHAWMCLGLQ